MNMTRVCVASLLGLSWLTPIRGAEAPRNPNADPEGLSASDWSSLRAAYEAGRHQFFKQTDGTHVARNHAQQWHVVFDGRGFMAKPDGGEWEWGLELVQYSASDGQWTVDGKPVVAAQGNRLTMARDAILEEWFINDGRGLEQGWTIKQCPAGAGEGGSLRIELAVRGGLKAIASDTGESVSFRNAAGATVLTYGGLKAWDARGRVLAAGFTVKDSRIVVEVDERGASYPITIDPIAQLAYLKASNTDTSDRFGNAVAISGDTAVIGAPFEDSKAKGVNGNQASNTGDDPGAAYVFVRTGTTWTQQAYLKASNTGANDNFGSAVAISGNSAVIGAPEEDSNATGVNGTQTNESAEGAGAAYVFIRSGTTWTQQAYLKASNTEAHDRFGETVAIDGNTVVVSAPLEDSNATGVNGSGTDPDVNSDSGAAYVFTRSGTTWTQQAYLKASNTGDSDHFGKSVAVAGDTVVVGAPDENSNATGVDGDQSNNSASNAGAAYVFFRTGTTWAQQAYLKASNTEAQDQFGLALALVGDTVVIGAPQEDSNATGVNGSGTDPNINFDSGAVYVFTRSGATWTQEAYLKASNTGEKDNFGFAVAISGNTVVVGAPQERSNATGVDGDQSNNSASSAGAVYVFIRNGTTWTQQAYLKASNTGEDHGFGGSVAVAGNTVVAGASGEDSSATGINGFQNNHNASDSGAAYVFCLLADMTSLAKTGYSAPGTGNIVFSAPGSSAVNEDGEVIFDQGLVGTGAAGGRNRAVFSTLAPAGTVDLVLQTGTSMAGVDGLPSSAKISAVLLPLANQQAGPGLFQAAVTGTGITTTNNRLLLKDDGQFVTLLARTGKFVSVLGGTPITFREVLDNHNADIIAISYLLKVGGSVFASNDSGLLPMNHAGTSLSPAAREGFPLNSGGTVGQLTGRAAASLSDAFVHFGATFRPASPGTPVPAIFSTDPTDLFDPPVLKTAVVGGAADGGGTFATFPGLTLRGPNPLFKATLNSVPAANNQGIWVGSTASPGTNTKLLRKGDAIDPTNLPDVVVSKIVRFWTVRSDQVMVQVMLSGQGVTAANNQALLLRQGTQTLILMRTGDPAPGFPTGKLLAFSAVDVNPHSRHYAVLGTVTGVPSTTNQGLWSGQTTLPTNAERLPHLCLRKGGIYTTGATPLGVIKSLTLKPAVDTTGAGGRGLSQAVGSGGHAAVYILTDGGVTELVLLKL